MQTQAYPGGRQGPSSNPSTGAQSLLVADCGAVFTKVSLFGLVEGNYRLLARAEAPTTIRPPDTDILVGIRRAIKKIESITGRMFLAEEHLITPEQDNGDGVDLFISTVSAAGPLRFVVLGGVNQDIEKLVSQATSGLYAETQAVPSVSYLAATTNPPAGSAWTRESLELEREKQLAHLRELQPHAALIVGMADGPAGPNPLQEACQLLVEAVQERFEQPSLSSTEPGRSLSVLYAGAPQYVEAVRRMVYEVADLVRLDPFTSPAQLGSISVAVSSLYEQRVLQRLPGFQQLSQWGVAAPMPTATSLSSLVRFLAQHYAMNVAAVDAGGASTTVMIAGEQGEFIPMVQSTLGVGPSAGEILRQAGADRILRWLPFSVSDQEFREFILHRIEQPATLPNNQRELQMTQALAREAIALTIEEIYKNCGVLPNPDLILATGGVLAHAPKYGQVALMLLDALQPRGVTSLVLDKTMLISKLGAVASIAPLAAVQVNENDAVSHRLGTCVVPFGAMRAGELAIQVGVEYNNGRHLTVDVMAGSIEVIPLRLNEQALLSLFPAPGVDVGLGPGERARAAEEIDGGLVGLIIDARGRPLIFPPDETERHARLLQWSQALGA